MEMKELFSTEELKLIQRAFSPRNGNAVLGTQYRLDLMDRSGFITETREHFSRELRLPHPERYLARAYLTRELSGKRIIELGPGPLGMKKDNAQFFAVLGASEYVGVEPLLSSRNFSEGEGALAPPITFIPRYSRDRKTFTLEIPFSLHAIDGLSYLLKQPDDSAIVFSSCVFRHDTLTNIGLPPELAQKYVERLIEQMYRVTPRGGIGIHADNSFDNERFQTAGFILELNGPWNTLKGYYNQQTEKVELEYLIGRGGVILRK